MGLFRRKRNTSDAQEGPAAPPATGEATLEDVMAQQARELTGLAEAVFHPAPLPGPLDLLSYREEDPLVLVVGEPDFEPPSPAYSKVRGRVLNGPEDDIPFFYDGLVSAVAQRRSALIV